MFAWDDEAKANRNSRILDAGFIAEHTDGFEAFEAKVRETNWQEIEQTSGLPHAALEDAARTYANARSVIAICGMGLTQHKLSVDNVQMLINLLLMRGNIGRPGAGICPVRGHSNVQASAPSASRRRSSWCRSTGWRSATASSRRARTA